MQGDDDTSLSHQSTLTSEHVRKMVSALDATAEKAKEIEALQKQLKQAEDRALLYEVSPCQTAEATACIWMLSLPTFKHWSKQQYRRLKTLADNCVYI